MKYALKMIQELLSRQDKKSIIILVFFVIFISLIETVGISVIMPFLSVAMDFDLIHENKYYKYVYESFSFTIEYKFVALFGIVLIFFYFFRSIMNLLYVRTVAKFTNNLSYSVSNRLFSKYCNISYLNFTKINSSTLTKTLTIETAYLLNLINALLMIFSEILVIVLLYLLMFYVNTTITIALTIFLFINALVMVHFITKKIKKAGVKRENQQTIFYEVINKTFGNFKILKLHQNNASIENDFRVACDGCKVANIYYGSWAQFPRLFLEAIGFSIIISIVVYLVLQNKGDISTVLPIISVFALALYRLMPSVNRIMTALNTIAFYNKSLSVIYNDLVMDGEVLFNDNIIFSKNISLENITFEYIKGKKILNNISLDIPAGKSIAFIGESGSGKSTLVDLLIGLYSPKNGTILIDGKPLNSTNKKQWREKIGYIPQSVYLFDGTVGENIILGSTYDQDKIDDCLKKANIYNFLLTKNGQKTYVGEGGIQLSGGQKQRIAIARALYHNPEVLVLDEATSALDHETEQIIMDEIYNICKDKTLIIIAHRLSTIEKCDVVYRLDNGELIETK
jgi:ATP-binding cassette, subfamily B, bacterial PglK